MKCWAVGNYGANYTPGDVREVTHLEEFASMREAGEALWRRVRGMDQDFRLADRDSTLHVWLSNPQGEDYVWPFLAGDEYPHRVISIGPRDGIRNVWS